MYALRRPTCAYIWHVCAYESIHSILLSTSPDMLDCYVKRSYWIYIHAYTCTYSVYMNEHIHACIYSCMHSNLHTHLTHSYIHACISEYMHGIMDAYITEI